MKLKKIFRILVFESVGDLFKHNTFLVLVLFLMLLDKGVEKIMPDKGNSFDIKAFTGSFPEFSNYLFISIPEKILLILNDYRFFLVVIGLFFFKQLTSLWPSSDMRLMHRNERGALGIILSLFSLKWQKILFDTIAVISLCIISLTWVLSIFFLTKTLWISTDFQYASLIFILLCLPVFPLLMSGLSYSSKIAVIDKGSFKNKLGLFFKLFTDKKIFTCSMLFYILRAVIESIFVIILPFIIIISFDIKFFRIAVALFIATPVYSFLKMASFKFFLIIYKDQDLIKSEYNEYYKKLF